MNKILKTTLMDITFFSILIVTLYLIANLLIWFMINCVQFSLKEPSLSLQTQFTKQYEFIKQLPILEPKPIENVEKVENE